jgi:hypothetical protein
MRRSQEEPTGKCLMTEIWSHALSANQFNLSQSQFLTPHFQLVEASNEKMSTVRFQSGPSTGLATTHEVSCMPSIAAQTFKPSTKSLGKSHSRLAIEAKAETLRGLLAGQRSSSDEFLSSLCTDIKEIMCSKL